jgi:hypothetical protein
MTDSSDERGTVTKASPLESVLETLKSLRRAMQMKDLEEYALIDHGGAPEDRTLQTNWRLESYGRTTQAGRQRRGRHPRGGLLRGNRRALRLRGLRKG